MLKNLIPILTLYLALAFTLGHSLVEHHHHSFEDNNKSHHHSNNTHSHDSDNERNDNNECNVWNHLFSGLQHSTDGLTFLDNYHLKNSLSKQVSQFARIHTSNFTFQQIIIGVEQNIPLCYIPVYYNSQTFLPCGLRAPPISIV